ncbi:MAG: ATP-binding cassette domain-containing protein [Verrucomicrobia bacterium]|nr:ATP-binding cassette domain-containing protein [Verrucomicrobiota bacterium]
MNAAADNKTPALLELEGVSLAAPGGGAPLVENIRWRVARGDYWVVSGLSGAGKSSLLATAAGLQRPVCGEQRLFGREVAHLSEAELIQDRRRVGLVFGHGGRLFSRHTVAENLSLPLCYHNNCAPEEVAETVARWLESLGLTAWANQPGGRLNRAMAQRAALARALVLQPELLLLDNPVGGLEPRQAHWWMDFLDRLAAGHELLDRRPVTLVVATEDLHAWVSRGRQFAHLHDGRWETLGGREALEKNSAPWLREFLTEEMSPKTI